MEYIGYYTTLYRNRGNDGTVNLNRLNNNVLYPTGQYCCELPNVADVSQTLCANIGKCSVLVV